MDKRRNRNQIQSALDATLSGLRDDPWLAQRVIAEAKGAKKTKKKISVGLVLAVALIFAAVTAAAAILLSMKQIVDERAVPMANEYPGESYTMEDTNLLVRLAEENGIELSQSTKDKIAFAAAQGEGYYKEELIMAMAKAEFGDQPSAWSLEEQKWFDDVCVAIGFISSPEKKLPDEAMINPEQAMAIAKDYIYKNYGNPHDLDDVLIYRRGIQFIDGTNDGEYNRVYYTIIYEPLTLDAPEYWVYLSERGEILNATVSIGVSEGASYSEVEDRFMKLYGFDMTKWPQPILQVFRAALNTCQPTKSKDYLSFMRVSYPSIDENALSKEHAEKIGANALKIHHYSLDSAIYVESGGTTIWRLCYFVKEEDGSYAYYFADVECYTGTVLYARQQTDRWWMYYLLIPQSVCDEILKNWVDDKPAYG